MLAHHALAQVSHADVQPAPAGWTFLYVIHGLRHGGISYYRLARREFPGHHSTKCWAHMQIKSGRNLQKCKFGIPVKASAPRVLGQNRPATPFKTSKTFAGSLRGLE